MVIMKIFNTLTRELEEFITLEDGVVKMYHCGPTVYWVQHIGNIRAMVMGDLVRRMLEYQGYEVIYTRNYTDFGHLVSDADTGEDKMEKGAKREGLTLEEIANKYIQIFNDDTHKVNNLPATYSTRATEYIQEMIEMIQIMLDKGYAYSTSEAIYFDVSKFPTYTDLSGQRLDKMIEGAGFGDDVGSKKRNPADFALWFFKTGSHENTSLSWESPFESELVENGLGTPGWHIECSAMAIAKLGNSMDIHMGGVEHIPIHHTNEIAQSEACTGQKFARYWVHNEHLTVNGGKMSKSEGTSFTVKDIEEKGYDPIYLRYYFLLAHYRSKQDFTWDSLEVSKKSYDKLVKKLSVLESDGGVILEDYKEKFIDAIGNDFNSPQGLALVWTLLADPSVSDADKIVTIFDFDRALGLNLQEAVINANEPSSILPKEVSDILELRRVARENKDYEESDRLRDEIDKLGYLVKDTGEGQEIEPK
jgi:cysteinyl-tRNA synthetase